MKVIAYFGSDLRPGNGHQILTKAHRNGYTLLALDSQAVLQAVSAGLEYTVLEDWISPENILRAMHEAEYCETGWFEPGREYFTVDGLCWPEFDHVAMRWFWQDAVVAGKLACAFNERRVKKLTVFANYFSHPAVLTERSDAAVGMLKSEFEGETITLKRPGWRPGELWKGLRGQAYARLRGLLGKSSSSSKAIAPDFIRDSLVLVLGQLEAVRFSGVMRELSISFGDRLVAVAGGPYASTAAEMEQDIGVPVAVGATWPLPPKAHLFANRFRMRAASLLAEEFRQGYGKCLQEAQGTPWHKPLQSLGFHFEYYLAHRWPVLQTRTLAFWSELWSRFRPCAVMITNVWQSYYLCACKAASQLGIPTFLVSHGAVQALPSNLSDLFTADHILYEGRLQRTVFVNAGADPQRLIPCRGLIAESEFPSSTACGWPEQKDWRVLALLSPTGVSENLVPMISIRAQQEALKVLASPPEDLRPRLSLHLKVHPYYSDLQIIDSAGSNLRSLVLPLDADLNSMLDKADLVIAVNYTGTALIHAFRLAKPVIALMTESPSLLKRPDVPYDLFSRGCVTVREADEFWSCVRGFFTDPEIAADMTARSKAFARQELDSTDSPGLGECLSRLLGETNSKTQVKQTL